MKLRMLLFISCWFVGLVSCQRKLSNEEICNRWWKYHSKRALGDYLDLKEWKCACKNDTIFWHDTAAFKIVSAHYDPIAKNEKMEIIEIPSGDTGIYVSKY